MGETEMQLEVLKRDKKMLLEDLDRSKERERNTAALCEGEMELKIGKKNIYPPTLTHLTTF